MKKIGVYTSGGDAPGMNACVRAVVRKALFKGIEVVGIRRGYRGMIHDEVIPLDQTSVANIIQRGGTFLKTARSEEFRTPEGRQKAFETIQRHGIEGLICIGGNGSYAGAKVFHEEFGVPCIGVPGTIDNDLFGTDYTIGYDTAINTALDAIDKIRDTADSHDRVFLVEVMGRDSGFIALDVGIAGGAEGILIPEDLDDINRLRAHFQKEKRKKNFSIIVVAEGDEQGGAYALAKTLSNEFPELVIKSTILGHIQRGGNPTARDRILATRLGSEAVEALMAGRQNMTVGIVNDHVNYTPFELAISNKKSINQTLLDLTAILAT
jgi:6-phosphofructokinase 1